MLHRLALAAAFALAALSLPAKAQQITVVPACGASSGMQLTAATGGRFSVTPDGTLCTVAGGGGSAAAGSVTAAGTPGTQAQAVQGIPNGVPQNSYPCQYNATLPTLPTGTSGYLSCDSNGRALVILGSSQSSIGFVVPTVSTNSNVGISPSTTTGSSLIGKAAGANLYGYHATFGATAGYVALLNVTAVPAAGAAIAPLECTPVAANSSYRTRQDFPDRYAVGLVLIATSSCTTYTAVTPQLMAVTAN